MRELSVKECHLVSGFGSCSCSRGEKKIHVPGSDVCRNLCCQGWQSFFYYENKKDGKKRYNCRPSSTMEIVRKRLKMLGQQVAIPSNVH